MARTKVGHGRKDQERASEQLAPNGMGRTRPTPSPASGEDRKVQGRVKTGRRGRQTGKPEPHTPQPTPRRR
eukprot:6006362-Pyramimonas_sp.AAC.1